MSESSLRSKQHVRRCFGTRLSSGTLSLVGSLAFKKYELNSHSTPRVRHELFRILLYSLLAYGCRVWPVVQASSSRGDPSEYLDVSGPHGGDERYEPINGRMLWVDKGAETLSPELDLIDSRIVHPCKELNDICKKIRKSCTKRDHKLVDYDRHNNSLNKLREKKEKSLSDEKNLFKVDPHFSRSSRRY